MRTASISITPILALLGCGHPSPAPEEAQVLLAVSAIPPDVACLRLTASGSGRSVERELDVGAGAPVNETFAGLPLGVVQFKGEAFTAGCASVTRSTVAAWVSDLVPISVAVGRITTVALTLHRNGRARVSVDFTEDPDAGPRI